MSLRLIAALIVALSVVGAGPAFAADPPQIDFISFGPDQTSNLTAIGMLHSLASYGFIGKDDPTAVVLVESDYSGEKLAINWHNANFDLPTANVVVDSAIDSGADIIVALTPAIAQIAVGITSEMYEPLPVFFAVIEDPFRLRIADSPCIKPAHVTGTLAPVPYAEIVSLILAQNPELQTLGAVYALGDGLGEVSTRQLEVAAEAHGLLTFSEGVASTADIGAAAAGLLADGVQAFVQPSDSLGLQGLPIVSAAVEGSGIPVYHSDPMGIFWGATVSAGFFRWYDQGKDIGSMIAAYLNGELDIATTAINQRSSAVIYGVNHMAAASAGVELKAEVADGADFALSAEGEIEIYSMEAGMEFARVNVQHGGGGVPDEATQRAEDAELFASLACSDERVAAEKAELEG